MQFGLPGSTSGRKWVAAMQLVVALLLMIGIWVALPARYAVVDVLGTGVALLYAGAAAGLLSGARWGHSLARVVSYVALGLGALTVTLLAMSAAQLAGLYGPVGSGGALLLGTVALLVLPYLVALPAVQLALLRRGH
jgi:hypothetical protein